METWFESVHSDGTAAFVSNPSPKIGENVTIRLRMYEDAPVKHVILRYMPNGMERLDDMHIAKREHGFVYYEASLYINERRIQYHFYLVCENRVYFYTQREITTYLPDHSYDFVLLADYVQPEWVREAVFYQIFPERFCNGDPDNDVRSGEYSQNGHPTIQMKDWNLPALTYHQGYCLDFFGGDLQGIQQKIPYLKELGVTALYLNPIFYAPSSHKYDCLDYFHVDPHFGGDQALADLSAALHANGMKLILDISINHTGIAHKWFNRDGDWFDKKTGAYNNPDALERKYYFFQEDNSYHGWFHVDTMPTLNYTSEELRHIIYSGEDSVLKKWLKPPYCIDGWRFDVADTFARNPQRLPIEYSVNTRAFGIGKEIAYKIRLTLGGHRVFFGKSGDVSSLRVDNKAFFLAVKQIRLVGEAVAELGYHNLFAESAAGFEICKKLLGCSVPIRIVGCADNVIVDSCLFNFFKELPIQSTIIASFEMKQNFCLRRDLTASAAARINKAEKSRIIGLHSAFAFELSDGPKHTVGYLVADLNELGENTGIFCLDKAFFGEFVYFTCKRVKVISRPRFRNDLLAGVCPEIAVMKVEKQVKSLGFCQLAKGDVVVDVAVARKIGLSFGTERIVP